jgi:Nif-specific regulatory protein
MNQAVSPLTEPVAATRSLLTESLSFSCQLGECRSELLPLLSEVSKVVSREGAGVDAKTPPGHPRDDFSL